MQAQLQSYLSYFAGSILMTSLSVARNSVGKVPPWSDDALDVSKTVSIVGGAGGFLWVIFRFLVGSVIANTIKDVSNLRSQVEALNHSMDEIRATQMEIWKVLSK